MGEQTRENPKEEGESESGVTLLRLKEGNPGAPR